MISRSKIQLNNVKKLLVHKYLIWTYQGQKCIKNYYLSHIKGFYSVYSNTSQTRGSKLAKFSNSRFLLLFFTSKLAVPLLSTQIRDFCYFLSPKNCEFGGITVHETSYTELLYYIAALMMWFSKARFSRLRAHFVSLAMSLLYLKW